MSYKFFAAVIAWVIICGMVSAVPTTNPASLISSNNVTFSGSGMASPNWFDYGMSSGYLIWKTPNQTAAGLVNYTEVGSPLIGGQVYYYKACDNTGCGAEETFTLATVTPQPQTTFSYVYENITQSGFDPAIVAYDAVQPYFWVSPPSVVWGLLFFFIFAALWVRGRDVTIPSLLGLITGFMVFNPTYGIQMPAEFIGMSQGICYASLSGIILALFKK